MSGNFDWELNLRVSTVELYIDACLLAFIQNWTNTFSSSLSLDRIIIIIIDSKMAARCMETSKTGSRPFTLLVE
jgi:hypothetical protein